MLFLLRRVSRSYPVLALLATNLVISMPAPPSKRSPEDASNGFSNVPKILEIQLPLKIATKDDLVAWAKYVMGLMASRINITLTTVKETAPKISTNSRNPNNVKQPQNIKNSAFRQPENIKQTGNIQTFAVKNFENSRYAENSKNLGNVRSYEYTKNSGMARPLENSRLSDNIRIPLRNMNLPSPKEKFIATTNLPTLGTTGLTLRSSFGNGQTYPSFTTFGISPTTIQSPLEITANINLARPRINEQEFKGTFNTANPLRLDNRQLFVPESPDFIDLKLNDIFRNTNAVSPPSRAYLPVTTADSIKFPTNPFATRYFYDGVERNISSNLGVLPLDVPLTTHRPSVFKEEIPLPVKNIDLTPRRNSSSSLNPLFKLPFEAVITITRENSGEVTTTRTGDKYMVIPSREPPDAFPPYFETNYTLTNESDQINVVFEDGSRVTESMNDKKKEEKKKNSSSKQGSKKQKTTTKRPSTIGQIVKAFANLRRNNSLATDLTPPPLKPQKFPTPPRTQVSTERPSFPRPGRRNQTSLAQELEDDDDDGDSNNASEDNSNESNGGDKIESNEGSNNSGSKENSSNESEDSEDYDDDEEEGGGSIKAIIDLLQLVAPILEDLSDPESDTDIAEVVEAAVPILQELSEGDGETEGIDIPGVLVPVLLQFSEGADGPRDSGAILRPLIQVIAPLIGPLVGPLLVPLSRQSHKPPDGPGSNSGDFIKTLFGPLSEPTGPGKMSLLSNLIATVVSSLSQTSSYGKGKSDISSLVKAIVAGSVAGSSAGSSGQKDSYGAPTSYGGDYGGGGGGGGGNSYNPPGVPSTDANPLLLLGSSIKDILNAIVKVVASLVSAITGLFGASSSSSNEPSPAYGPPPTYGTRPSYMVPPNQPFTGTTRSSVRNRG